MSTPGSAAGPADEAGQRRELLYTAAVELMAARTSAFFTAGLLALAMLSAALGAAVAALQGDDSPDTVLLFTATTMALVGVVCAAFALLSLRTLRRDVLADLQRGRPPRGRRATTMPAAWIVFAAGLIVGIALAAVLWMQSLPLAMGVFGAAVIAGCIGFGQSAAQRRAEATMAAASADPAVAEWLADAAPAWLHEALARESEAARNRARRQQRLFGQAD